MVTDLVMDEVEGIELIVGLRKAGVTIPVIAMSADPIYLSYGGRLGADHVLLKPFRALELLSCVAKTFAASA